MRSELAERDTYPKSMIAIRRLRPLPRSFYLRPAPRVARELLGKLLRRRIGSRVLVALIVETEAYRQNDPASHSYRGRTKRNEVMFREGGHLYVYFTYGMHFCANVVTGGAGKAEAVLIRAVQPLVGGEQMRKNRAVFIRGKNQKRMPPTHLTNGPAKLCQALGIGRKENGIDLLGDEVSVLSAPNLRPSEITTTTRIGIRIGTEARWRYFIKGNEWVSQ